MADWEINEKNMRYFEEMLATFMPEMYILWHVMTTYKLNFDVLPHIARALGSICTSTKSGKVVIEIVVDKRTGEPRVYRVNGEHIDRIDMPALKSLT